MEEIHIEVDRRFPPEDKDIVREEGFRAIWSKLLARGFPLDGTSVVVDITETHEVGHMNIRASVRPYLS